MKIFPTLLFCCLLLVATSQTFAAPSAALSTISFAQAKQLWQNGNRELQLAHDQLRGAAADQLIAGQKPNLTLAFNTTSIETGQPTFMKQADSVLRVEQLFERGDKRALRVRAADLRSDAARADFAAAQRQGLIDLAAHYYDLALTQAQLRIAEDSARLFAASVSASQLRVQAGDLAAADLARLQVDALRAQNDVETTQNILRQAQAALAYRLRADIDTTKLSADERWPQAKPPASGASLAAIVERRPDIIAADQRAAAAEAAFAQAQALRTRDITVGVQVEHNGQNRPLNTVGIGFSVPLMTGYAYAGEITRARIDLESAQRVAEQVRAQAYLEIANARGDLTAAQIQVERFDSQLLPASQRALAATELGYRQGATPLLDLLDARRIYKATQLEAVGAHANYAKALATWQITAAIDDVNSVAEAGSQRIGPEKNP